MTTSRRNPPDRALSYLTELIEHAEKVLRFPRAGRVFPEAELDELREVIHENHRIIYLIQESQALIIAVVEGHRLLRVADVLESGSGKK